MKLFQTLWKWISGGVAASQDYAAMAGVDPKKTSDELLGREKEEKMQRKATEKL